MKAVLLKGPNKVVIEEMSLPKIEHGEILVEMKACGLCGTDIEKMHGQYTAARPVLGHEAAGIITEVGKDVDGLEIGDRVFPHHHTPCHSCHFCKHSSETMCDSFRMSNLDPCGFAEFFRVPAFNIQQGGVLKLPESVGFEAASLIEPISCCIRGLNRSKISKGDSVLVIGAGPMGLMHLQLLKQLGAKVLISEINPIRIAYAEKMGAHQIYDAAKMDVPSTVRKDTDGRGVDVALVAAGSPKTIIQALKSVRKGGTVCLFGVPVVGSILDYDFSNIFNSEISIVSSYGSTERETKEALRMIEERRIDTTSLITSRFRLEEFEKAVDTAIKGDSLKIVITP